MAMRTDLLLAAALSLVACSKSPCEQAHEHIAECLDVTYKADSSSRCLSPTAPPNVVAGEGCSCEGISACESECFVDTACKWIVEAYKGETVVGLTECLERCGAAN